MKLLPLSLCLLLMNPGMTFAQGSPLILAERTTGDPLYYFGGQKTALPLLLVSSRGVTCEIRIRLFQMAKDLGAPLSPLTPLEGNPVFQADVPTRISAPVILPTVKTRALAVLKVEAKEKGGPEWLPVGQVFLLIFPEENIAAKALLKSATELTDGGVSFTVYGQDPFFPDLLTELKIPFERAQIIDSVPRGTAMVCLGRSDDWNLPPSATRQKNLVRLISDISHPSGIFIVATPDAFEAKINLAHPEALSKPAKWDLLSQLFLQLQQAASLSTGKTTL